MNNHLTDSLPVYAAMNFNTFNEGNPEECSICFEVFVNKAFVNTCLHQFCYNCIVTWSKVKAVCPLCIQPINGIINNIRSLYDYDIEPVIPPEYDVLANNDSDFEIQFINSDEESSYDDYDEADGTMEMSGSDFSGLLMQEDFDDGDDVNYHSDSSENIQFNNYDFSDNNDDEIDDNDQNEAASVLSENNESICDDESKDDNDDWDNGDGFSEGGDPSEDGYSDHDDDVNNNDEYEADDDDEEDKNEENYSDYEDSENADSDAEEDNENSIFCDNLSYDNESEDESSGSYTQEEYNYDYPRDDDSADDTESDAVKLDFDVDDVYPLSDPDYYECDHEYLYPASYF